MSLRGSCWKRIVYAKNPDQPADRLRTQTKIVAQPFHHLKSVTWVVRKKLSKECIGDEMATVTKNRSMWMPRWVRLKIEYTSKRFWLKYDTQITQIIVVMFSLLNCQTLRTCILLTLNWIWNNIFIIRFEHITKCNYRVSSLLERTKKTHFFFCRPAQWTLNIQTVSNVKLLTVDSIDLSKCAVCILFRWNW